MILRTRKPIRSLAELYNRKKEFDKSIEYYELFNKTNLRSESAVDRAIVHTKLRRYDHQIESVSGEEADKLTEERKAFEIEQIQKLSDTYPSDLTLRFELGVLQFESGDAVGHPLLPACAGKSSQGNRGADVSRSMFFQAWHERHGGTHPPKCPR